MLNTEHARRYANHALAKRKLEEKAKEIGRKLDEWAQPLIDHFIDEEIDKISLKGGITLSLKEMIWAKIVAKTEDGQVDKKRVVAALYDADLPEYINDATYNSQALSAYLRELDRANEPLPEALKGIVEPNPIQSVIVKKL